VELQVKNAKQNAALTVADSAFGREFNEALVHQIVTAFMAGARAGTRAQKTRAEVRGGGKKPWKQKGTGNARAGTIRSPLWRGGGITFAAQPQDHSQKVNKKMYRGAMSAILSELLRQDRLIVVEDLSLAEPKTKLLLDQLKNLDLDDVLIVTAKDDDNLFLAARNVYKVGVLNVKELDPVSLIGFGKVLMTVDAVRSLEGWLA